MCRESEKNFSNYSTRLLRNLSISLFVWVFVLFLVVGMAVVDRLRRFYSKNGYLDDIAIAWRLYLSLILFHKIETNDLILQTPIPTSRFQATTLILP